MSGTARTPRGCSLLASPGARNSRVVLGLRGLAARLGLVGTVQVMIKTKKHQTPVPDQLDHLRRDAQGRPAPVNVAWRDGVPVYSEQAPARDYLAGSWRLCAICGYGLADGELYFVSGGDDERMLLESKVSKKKMLAAFNAGGHRECVLYTAALIPELRAAAIMAKASGDGVVRGVITGHSGWACEFADDEVRFRLSAASEVIFYDSAEEILEMATNALATAPVRVVVEGAPVLHAEALDEDALVELATERARLDRAPIRVEKVAGRNDPCPCGSGRKYKACCAK